MIFYEELNVVKPSLAEPISEQEKEERELIKSNQNYWGENF